MVEGHISHMKTIVDLVQRGEALLQEGNPTSALPIFKAAQQQNGWLRIHLGIALCHKQLGEREQSLQVTNAALKEQQVYLLAWRERHLHGAPPDHDEAEQGIQRLKELRQSMSKAAARTGPKENKEALKGAAAEPPATGTGARRSIFWLASGITAAALTVGFEVGAWISYNEANSWFTHEPEYQTYRELTITGHVLAGVGAAAAATSFVFYYLSGSGEASGRQARLMMVPSPGGASIAGSIRF